MSDMTAFYVKGTYYELTLYMDLWNDELIAHALSSRRGDRMTYLDGLQDVLAFKKQYRERFAPKREHTAQTIAGDV